jgi:hypothetical protein
MSKAQTVLVPVATTVVALASATDPLIRSLASEWFIPLTHIPSAMAGFFIGHRCSVSFSGDGALNHLFFTTNTIHPHQRETEALTKTTGIV